MRSSSLATTILHENNPINDSLFNSNNNNQQLEKSSSSTSIDKLLFNTTSTINSKLSYWTVTDRQAEWYKLPIPINPTILNSRNDIVPFKKITKISERKKLDSNHNDQINQPT